MPRVSPERCCKASTSAPTCLRSFRGLVTESLVLDFPVPSPAASKATYALCRLLCNRNYQLVHRHVRPRAALPRSWMSSSESNSQAIRWHIGSTQPSLHDMSQRRVCIVAHTHWDREWYEPFQTFRMKLVDVLDDLLDLLESDPSYSHFLLDGQLAVIDDYLAIRPKAGPRIRALAQAGRLAMGPWYVLMDEFLVSAETIVRDLQMGMVRASEFGGAMEVGYLPDMFGHIAQMPQILRLAGIEHAVVWRGVPSQITATGFWWEAPDGSSVRAEYLPTGYGNGAMLPQDAPSFIRRIQDYETEISTFLIDALLCMNGSDHLPAQRHLGKVVADANIMQDTTRYEMTSLSEYLRAAPIHDLQRWKGELRSGARANLLMGVTSNRVDVKRSAAKTERSLERRAEPYAALYQPGDQWPRELLDLAWLYSVQNSAHDSICACSIDDVVDAVLYRYAQSRQIADGIADRALRVFGESMAKPGPVIVNPSPRRRSGVVELVIESVENSEMSRDNLQVISERQGLPGSMTLDATTVRTVMGMLNTTRIDDDAWVQDIRVDEDETGIDLTVSIGSEERTEVPLAEVKQDMYSRLGARPNVVVRVHLDQRPIQRVVAKVSDVPGLGWSAFNPQPISNPVRIVEPTRGENITNQGATGEAHRDGVLSDDDNGAFGASNVEMSNGLVDVLVRKDGTFDLNGIAGFGRLVDGGDLGDSYNYSPPRNDTFVTTPETVKLTVQESGPIRSIVSIHASYRWPDHVDGSSQSRVGECEVDVETRVELRADEDIVRVQTTFVNPSRDHRLRVHLPLPTPAQYSEAESAFGAVTRGLIAEGRPDELGLATYPSRRFVTAGGITIVHDGVCEYELIDIEELGETIQARTIALTVLRSTGMLSRLGMKNRPFPAGPLSAVDGLQLAGKAIDLRYALALGEVDPWAMADDVLLPLEVVTSLGGGWRKELGSSFELHGAELSALRREAGLIEVRVFNPHPNPTSVSVGHKTGWIVDLRGRVIQSFQDTFELKAFGIATLRVPADDEAL